MVDYKLAHPWKALIFEKEIETIITPSIQQFAEICLDKTPDYFFSIPASSSGRHHPSYALGEGGLVRHTKAAVGIFNELLVTEMGFWYQLNLTIPHDDIIRCALILHDTHKSGEENTGNTVHEHPIIAANFIRRVGLDYYLDDLLMMGWISQIARCVESHMGRWTRSKYSTTILPNVSEDDLHNSWSCRLVHLCDYLASRKCLEYKFDI